MLFSIVDVNKSGIVVEEIPFDSFHDLSMLSDFLLLPGLSLAVHFLSDFISLSTIIDKLFVGFYFPLTYLFNFLIVLFSLLDNLYHMIILNIYVNLVNLPESLIFSLQLRLQVLDLLYTFIHLLHHF